MNVPRARALAGLVSMLILTLAGPGPLDAEEPQRDAAVKRQLARFLEGGSRFEALSSTHPLATIRAYPTLATISYLLWENEPALLGAHYGEISRAVTRLFDDDNTAAGGLVRGMPGSTPASGSPLSPGFNALANLELHSLHLIAWKTGAYEDALEYLAWSRSFAALATRSFYGSANDCFFPLSPDGELLPTGEPGQLLPLVLDESLGSAARRRILDSFPPRIAAPAGARGDALDPWNDRTMRPVVLGLLSTVASMDREPLATLRSGTGLSAPTPGSAEALWRDIWRESFSFADRLFPPWNTISTIVNVVSLLGRESLVPPKELARLRGGVDSLVMQLADPASDFEGYTKGIAAANDALARFTRFSELLGNKKERWRVMDDMKWARLSPRIKRLVTEGLAYAPVEIVRAKTRLSAAFERSGALDFRLALPSKPVFTGTKMGFTASLEALRDTLSVSRLYLQIGDTRWKLSESSEVVSLVPGGTPFRFDGVLPLAPETEPGIVTVNAFVDFVHEGRRIEIRRTESVVVTNEYDVDFALPHGRKLGNKALPVDITVGFSPDHDIQGSVEGTFLREFTTTPPLPARFLLKKDAEKTDLTLTIAPKGILSPGRYPFSLAVSLNRVPIAEFKETLVRPFRWLHIGPFAKRDGMMRSALKYQADLLGSYPGIDGAPLGWNEVPPEAIDGDGALSLRRLYGGAPDRSVVLYTVIDSPSRMKLVWKLATKNSYALWINSKLLVSSDDVLANEAEGTIELRKGPNSFLIAASWNDAPDRVAFELSDESGLPASGLGNDLAAIVEGYELLGKERAASPKEEPPADRLREIVLSYRGDGVTEITVIGSFNNWEPASTPMRRDENGAWTARLLLRPGKYAYKFFVNRKTKIVDPSNAVTEPDGFGGSNSVLVVP